MGQKKRPISPQFEEIGLHDHIIRQYYITFLKKSAKSGAKRQKVFKDSPAKPGKEAQGQNGLMDNGEAFALFKKAPFVSALSRPFLKS
jgi:hypothetical protein